MTQAEIKREHAALLAVLTTQPTTIAGAVALLEHVGQGQFLDGTEEAENDDGFETVLSTWSHGNGELTTISKGFPGRLAATMRRLMAAA
jgi:hypothetical protein